MVVNINIFIPAQLNIISPGIVGRWLREQDFDYLRCPRMIGHTAIPLCPGPFSIPATLVSRYGEEGCLLSIPLSPTVRISYVTVRLGCAIVHLGYSTVHVPVGLSEACLFFFLARCQALKSDQHTLFDWDDQLGLKDTDVGDLPKSADMPAVKSFLSIHNTDHDVLPDVISSWHYFTGQGDLSKSRR